MSYKTLSGKGGGGHKGGHHHGGHPGSGHRRPGGWQGGWGPGWSYPGVWGAQPAYTELIVTPQCPAVIDPVLASDGKKYTNACEANAAGVSVVKKTKLGGIEAVFTKSQPLRIASYIASAAMTYHGYKRNNSVLWGLLWGATGLAGVPFALAQGFGKRKPGR